LWNVAALLGTEAGGVDDLVRTLEASAGLPPDVVRQMTSIAASRDLTASDALGLYPRYLEAAERLWQFVDAWKA
jgi:hypothetical protein